jgi:hypothetical protein
MKGHWVVIGLQNGESYSGYVDVADTSVGAQERDIILHEPAKFDDEKIEYRALKHQSLFIPGALVASVAVVHDPMLDKRIVPVGELVFPKEDCHAQESATTAERRSAQTNPGQGGCSASGPNQSTEHEHPTATADTKEIA